MTSDHARPRDRWLGWTWLAAAVSTPTFLIGTHAALLSREQQFLVASAFGAIGLLLWIADVRRGGTRQESARIDRSLTRIYVALVVVVAATAIVWDPLGPPAWFIVASLLPSVPCAVGAWRLLR